MDHAMNFPHVHRQVRLAETGRFALKEVATPEPREGEFLVKQLKIGVCGTDLDIARGARSDTAVVLGHEAIAAVVAAGPDATTFRVGQRIIYNPVNHLDQHDILGHSTEGVLQEYFLLTPRDVNRGLAVPASPSLPDICGPLVEPLATVIYGHSLVSNVCEQRQIAVIGAGPIGITNAIHARMHGSARVILVDTSYARLEWACKQGVVGDDEIVVNTGNLFADDILSRIEGDGVDALYLCTPRRASTSALGEAFQAVRSGGCIDLVCSLEEGKSVGSLSTSELNGVRRDNYCGVPALIGSARQLRLGGKQVNVVGHRGTSALHLKQAMDTLAADGSSYLRVVSHLVALSVAPDVLRVLVSGKATLQPDDVLMKVVVDPLADDDSIQRYDSTRAGHVHHLG